MNATHTHDDRLVEAGRALSEGNFTRAASLYDEVIPEIEARLGAHHDVVLQAELEWGLALYGLGRYAEAEGHQRRALDGRIRTIGADHGDTLNTRGRLAETIGEQGRWQECEVMARDTIALGKAKGWTKHDSVLLARLTLAWASSRQGRWIEAARLAADVHSDMHGMMGPDHRITLSAGNLLAQCLLHTGDLEGAEECAADVFRGRMALLGGRHPHTIAISRDLAHILVAAGKQHEAVLLARRVLPVATEVLGDEHAFTTGLHEICDTADQSAPSTPAMREGGRES